MSGTVPLITPRSITGISGLEKKPVYFLKLNGVATPNLVVKGEQRNTAISKDRDLEISITWGSKLMKNVQNSLVNTKIMAPGEIQVFKAAVQATFAKTAMQFEFARDDSKFKWVKMPYVTGLDDADIRIDKEFKNGDSSYTIGVFDLARFQETINKLANEAVWFQLGKVVAVDIFNGNNDRFNLATGSWDNLGNVMFLTGGGPIRVIGLDTFSPLSGNPGNLNKAGVFPELLVLVDAQKRKTFAEACTRGVGTTLRNCAETATVKLKIDGPKGPEFMELPVAKLPEFFVPYAPMFEQGLAHGAWDLKKYLQDKVKQYNAPVAAPAAAPRGFLAPQRNAPLRPAAPVPAKPIPQGILDRMKYLGWL